MNSKKRPAAKFSCSTMPSSSKQQKQQQGNFGDSDAVAEKAELTKQYLAKLEELKKLKKLNSNSAFLDKLVDKGAAITIKINGLELELKQLFRAVKGTGKALPSAARAAPPVQVLKSDINCNEPKEPDQKKVGQFGSMSSASVKKDHSSYLKDLPKNASDDGPKGLKVVLLQHQKEALAWALWQENNHPYGGILADDMGLGKTATMISLMMRSKELKLEEHDQSSEPLANGSKMAKTLLVCLASLLDQWETEIFKFCKPGTLTPYIFHGDSRGISLNRLCRPDIVITSYETVELEGKSGKVPGKPTGRLFQVKWDRIILDEAHYIRNSKTQVSQACCQLKANYHWCLTGTPVQNKLKDVYSLLNFIKFSPYTEEKVWRTLIGDKTSAGLEKLQSIVKSVTLRRTKADLLKAGQLECMPSKAIKVVSLKLSSAENEVYQYVLRKSKSLMVTFLLQKAERLVETGEDIFAVSKTLEKLRQDGFDELEKFEQGMQNHQKKKETAQILVLLLRLRQICCHLSLVKDKLVHASLNTDNADKTMLASSNSSFQIDFSSTKVAATTKLVQEITAKGEKVVVVSQWPAFLQIVKHHLKLATIPSTLFSGELKVEERPEIIRDFNKEEGGIQVLLLSLKTGGTGLNLIGGNNLILTEPHWNPQLEAQTMDRVYRIGQKRDVNIYKLICDHTIEMAILLMQEEKLGIANQLLTENEEDGLDTDNLYQLFLSA